VGVDSYIAKEFANRWVEQQWKKQKEDLEKFPDKKELQKFKPFYDKTEMNTMNNHSNQYYNPSPTIGRDYSHAKQFACRRQSQLHISTMVFTIFYSKEDTALYGNIQQRIRNTGNSNGLTDYFASDFVLNIHGKEIGFRSGETHAIDILKEAWLSLTDKSKSSDIRFDEVKEWANEHGT
jgi:hypothetical protein